MASAPEESGLKASAPRQISNDALIQVTKQIPTGNPRPCRKIKIPYTDELRGDTTQVRTCLQQCECKFTEYEKPMEAEKVIYAGSKLKGPVVQWIFPALEKGSYRY
jgi:hypothetical protein